MWKKNCNIEIACKCTYKHREREILTNAIIRIRKKNQKNNKNDQFTTTGNNQPTQRQ